MLGPLINPYGKNITKEESKAMWAGMRSLKSQIQYARHLPSFVPGKLKGTVQKVNKYMRNSKELVNQKVTILYYIREFVTIMDVII